jgi:hypothetical protein
MSSLWIDIQPKFPSLHKLMKIDEWQPFHSIDKIDAQYFFSYC